MKRHLLAASLTLSIALLPSVAVAIPVKIDVAPDLLDRPLVPGWIELPYALSRINLNGQSISLDFTFADDVLARIIGGGFVAILNIQTDAEGFPGLAGDATPVCHPLDPTHCYADDNGNPPFERASGYLLSRYGTPLEAAKATPTYMDPGILGLGFYSYLWNFDMSGLHYDVVLPTTGYEITGGSLRVGGVDRFGTTAQLPDTGSTVILLGLALSGLAGVRKRLR